MRTTAVVVVVVVVVITFAVMCGVALGVSNGEAAASDGAAFWSAHGKLSERIPLGPSPLTLIRLSP